MREYSGITTCRSGEQPVPVEWRSTFVEIVESLKSGDFKIERPIPHVERISNDEAERIAGNIRCYGSPLESLPEETWKTSVCRWMEDYWEVLVDLFTVRDGLSDLVLFSRVFERNGGYVFKVESVNVP